LSWSSRLRSTHAPSLVLRKGAPEAWRDCGRAEKVLPAAQPSDWSGTPSPHRPTLLHGARSSLLPAVALWATSGSRRRAPLCSACSQVAPSKAWTRRPADVAARNCVARPPPCLVCTLSQRASEIHFIKP
jgi:hypothetical protein